MNINFNRGNIIENKRFGDVGFDSDNQLCIVKRSFGQWAVHCLKYYNPFGTYRNRIKQERDQIYTKITAATDALEHGNVAIESRTVKRVQDTKNAAGIAPLAKNRRALLRGLSMLLQTREPDRYERTPETTYPRFVSDDAPDNETGATGQERNISVDEGTDNPPKSQQHSVKFSTQRWGDPQIAAGMLPDYPLVDTGLPMMRAHNKLPFKMALHSEMRERIEQKIVALKPEWKNAETGSEIALRKETTVAFLIMNHAF